MYCVLRPLNEVHACLDVFDGRGGHDYCRLAEPVACPICTVLYPAADVHHHSPRIYFPRRNPDTGVQDEC
jgi:hypothetical protein